MPRPKPHDRVAVLHDRAFRHGIKITEAIRSAGVAGSTWTRWVHGHDPVESTITKIDKALDDLIEKDD